MRARFEEKIKNRVITGGLTTVAVLFVIADRIGDMLSVFADSKGSVNRALREIDKHRSQSLSIKDYLEVLKEVSGVNLANTVSRLKEKGLISGSKKNYVLTDLGKEFVGKVGQRLRYRLNWDGKWRLITFDVPEKYRRKRDWLRKILQLHEYKQLHKSVFLGKFPLPEEVYRDVYKRKIAPFFHIITIGEIDDEEKLPLL